MRLLLFLVIGCLLLYSCTRKKKGISDLSDWLDKYYPGRFNVIETTTSDPIRNLSFSVKNSVVADKNDPLLQIVVRWDKRDAGLGVSGEKIEQQFEAAKQQLADVRALLPLVKQSGIERFSVSTNGGIARVLLFDKPTPENRKQYLAKLVPALRQWPAVKNYGLMVEFMVPETYNKEFGEIVPLQHWVRGDSWHTRHSIVYIYETDEYELSEKVLLKKWTFNTNSDQLIEWSDMARPEITVWAEKHLDKSMQLIENSSRYQELEDRLGAQLEFPFEKKGKTNEEESEIAGYIVCEVALDKGVVERIRIEKE